MTREESAKLDKLVDRIEALHAEVIKEIASREPRCVKHTERINSLSEVVFGNGAPGIKGQVASLIETRGNMRWGFGLIWSGMVAVVAALIKVWWGKG
jgi:hypothetical protein